jgi:hypothetical protein
MSRYSRTKHADIDRLRATIDDARVKVIKHPLYRRLETLEQGNTLYKQHVSGTGSTSSRPGTSCPCRNPSAQLACVDVPWVPRGAVASCRLINEIVLATINVTSLAPGCEIDLVTGAPREKPVRAALVLARGLGGFNAAAVLTSVN